MGRLANLLVACTWMLALCGCGEETPNKQQAEPQPALNEQILADAEDSPSAAHPSTEEVPEPDADESEVAEESAKITPLPERIVLLARGGPLLVDVWLTIDGQPIGEGLESLIDQVILAGDTDGDGRSTWSEWRENEEFLTSELAAIDTIRQRTLKDWVERYDENEDGRMQRGEAAAWLGRDGGRSATPLRIRSRRSYLAGGTRASRLWQILDSDGDGRLAGDEIELAAQRLFLLDTSDDRIVDDAELATLRDQLSSQTGQQSRFRRQSRRDAAIHLRDGDDARELDYVLSDLYAPRQQIGPSSFLNRPELFVALDADGDQSLDADELASMASIEPHLKLAVDFGSESGSESRETQIQVLEQAEQIEPISNSSSTRVVIGSADTRLIISGQDLSGNAAQGPSVQANQVSLMVHDQSDRLFEYLDVDANGKLGEREIVEAADRMRAADANADGQLGGEELPYSLVVAFLRAESPSERSFYVPNVGASAATHDGAPDWFLQADLNGDGDISRTEFLGSEAHFEGLDADRDNFITAEEAAAISEPNAELRP